MKHRWPETEKMPLPKVTTKGGQISKYGLLKSVFLNASGASFAGF
jgi:hypothetical protein